MVSGSANIKVTNPPPPPPPTTAKITIAAQDQNGNPIPGLFSVVTPAGAAPQTGFTPFSATVPINSVCQVQCQTSNNFIFSFWEDGATGATKQIVATGDMTIKAVFGTNGLPVPPPAPAGMVNIVYGTKTDAGNMLNGQFVTIAFAGQTLTRFSPTVIQVPQGADVIITPTPSSTNQATGLVSAYNHWEDDPTAPRARTIKANAAMTLIAVYQQTPVPTTTAGFASTSMMAGGSEFR